MSFSFGPTPPAPGAANPSQALSNAMAPAPVDLSSAIAANLQGVHDAAERYPALPANGQFDIEITEFRGNVGHFGLAFFVEGKVLQSNNGTQPGIYSQKIDGFNHPNSKQFAFRDLKSFIRAATARVQLAPNAPPGIPDTWNGSDAEWAGLTNQLIKSGVLKGQRVFAQTTQTAVGKTSGKSKTVASWIKAQ